MKLNKIKKIRSFSVLIVPDTGHSETTSHKLTPAKVAAVIILYSFIVFIFSGLLLAYTPLRDLFITKSNLSSSDLKKIEQLNTKMIFLTRELESLKSTNERLRYAIMLGDSSALDSVDKKDKSMGMMDKTGGNLLGVLSDLFSPQKNQPETSEFPFQNGKIKQEPLYYFYSPANGFISREFNPDKGHFGVDIVLKTGSPVYAAASGFIIFSDYTVKDGYMIIAGHSDGYITIYKHCSALIKAQKEIVVQGDLIALSGNTGEESAGPHLHFEIWKDGQPVNPKKLLINN